LDLTLLEEGVAVSAIVQALVPHLVTLPLLRLEHQPRLQTHSALEHQPRPLLVVVGVHQQRQTLLVFHSQVDLVLQITTHLALRQAQIHLVLQHQAQIPSGAQGQVLAPLHRLRTRLVLALRLHPAAITAAILLGVLARQRQRLPLAAIPLAAAAALAEAVDYRLRN